MATKAVVTGVVVSDKMDKTVKVAIEPQLVAGPIERASHFMPQMFRPRMITYEQTTRGLYLMLFGLFKKVAITETRPLSRRKRWTVTSVVERAKAI